ALGSEYVGAPYETRRADLAPESVPYRLMGVVDGTRLTFDPPIAGAPAMLDRGVVADINSAEPFVVTSQDAMHPFTFAQLMTSANLPGGSRPGATATGPYGLQLGDEEFVLAFPPAQYLRRYVFFTDPTYPTTNLVLVRVRNEGELPVPIFVDCLGEVSGFRPIGTSGHYEMTTVDLVRAGVGNHGCTNGPHSANSPIPFGLVVWGLDSFSSYAYAAGGNASRLATIDPPL
ncbi:MAG: IgGFc-binding protein, partial [Thermoanaerobaculia bacterium]